MVISVWLAMTMRGRIWSLWPPLASIGRPPVPRALTLDANRQ
jgi:hypothetical protein